MRYARSMISWTSRQVLALVSKLLDRPEGRPEAKRTAL